MTAKDTAALTIDCPTCGAPAGEPCKRKNALPGEEDPTQKLHRDRRNTAAPAQTSICYGCGASVFDWRPRILCPTCMRYPPHIQQRIRAAKERGLPWSLTMKQTLELLQQPCTYCGEPGGTLDRTDCHQGYTATNVVPSCWPCNDMKGTWPLETWLDHLHRILQHQGCL